MMGKRIPVQLNGEGIILDPDPNNDPEVTIRKDRDQIVIEIFNHGEMTGMDLVFNQCELLEAISE